MLITFKPFEKTLLYSTANTLEIKILQGTPTVRTNNHFTKYFTTKKIKILKNTVFSVYNCSLENLVIEADFSLCKKIQEEFKQCQHIGTGRIRKGKDRLNIFDKFMHHYSSFGYKVLTADTDHEEFNRAASRNVLASIFPNKVMVLIDGDAFYSKEQIDRAIVYAKDNDVVVKPTRFAEVGNKKINGYSGYSWVVRTHLWPGMDERCLTWGAEDVILMQNRLIRTEALNNGIVQILDHTRDEIGKPHNFELLKDYKDILGFPLDKNNVLKVLKIYCGYGLYGHFSEPRTANSFPLQE